MAKDGAEANGFGRLVHHFEEYRERTLGEIERVAAFARELPKGVRLAIAPEIEAGVRDLAALSRVAGYLTSGTAILKRLEVAAREVTRRENLTPNRLRGGKGTGLLGVTSSRAGTSKGNRILDFAYPLCLKWGGPPCPPSSRAQSQQMRSSTLTLLQRGGGNWKVGKMAGCGVLRSLKKPE